MSNLMYPKAGLHNMGSYLVSGAPYASSSIDVPVESGGSAYVISFPSVTQWVLVKNASPTGSGQDLRVGFSENGVLATDPTKANYYTLRPGETFEGKLKLSELYLAGDSSAATASIAAGLTNISIPGDFHGSYSGSAGVG